MGIKGFFAKAAVGAAIGAIAGYVARLLTGGSSTTVKVDGRRVTQTDGRLFIAAPAEVVYDAARDVTTLPELLAGVADVEVVNNDYVKFKLYSSTTKEPFELIVIADQPGEYVGFRIERGGVLYGTWLLQLDIAPGAIGTITRVMVRYKDMPEWLVALTSPIAKEQIDGYLAKLKAHAEEQVSASRTA